MKPLTFYTSFQVRQAPYMAGLALLFLRQGGDEVRVIRVRWKRERPLRAALTPLGPSRAVGPSVGQTNKRVIKVTVLRIGTEGQPCVFSAVWGTEQF